MNIVYPKVTQLIHNKSLTYREYLFTQFKLNYYSPTLSLLRSGEKI